MPVAPLQGATKRLLASNLSFKLKLTAASYGQVLRQILMDTETKQTSDVYATVHSHISYSRPSGPCISSNEVTPSAP